MSNIYSEITPNPLHITFSNNKIIKVESLVIKNITNKYILYHFLTNTKGLNIKPPLSYIQPNDSKTIELNIIKENIQKEELINSKILVKILQVDDIINSIEQAKEEFQLMKNNENDMQKIKISLNCKEEENNICEEKDNIETNDDNEINNNQNYEEIKSQLIDKINNIKKNTEIQRKKLEILMKKNNKTDNDSNNNESNKKGNTKNCDSFLIIFTILIGLVIGANFASGYNNLFHN